MGLGYDVYEDDRDFEQEGLTGNVRRYTTESMKFPCFVVCSTEEKPVKMPSILTLKRMLPTNNAYDETVSNNMIHIYFNQGDRTVVLGAIQPNQVKTFLRLFADNEVEGYLSDKERLEGMYLYVLAN